MNKGELVEAIVKETGVEKKDVDSVLKSFTKTITEQLVKRDRIQLIGFGTFETRERAARSGRNPQTGEVIQIAASIAPVFKWQSLLKRKKRRRRPLRRPRRRSEKCQDFHTLCQNEHGVFLFLDFGGERINKF